MTKSCRFALCRRAFVPVLCWSFSGLASSLDVEELNNRWSGERSSSISWAQLVIQIDRRDRRFVTHAPRPESITWRMRLGLTTGFAITANPIESEKEASSCASPGRGDYPTRGADLGILITRGR